MWHLKKMAPLISNFLSFLLISTSISITMVKSTGKYQLECTSVRCSLLSFDSPTLNINICGIMGDLQNVQITELRIETIIEGAFLNCFHLKSVNLSSNSLQSLPRDVFRATSSLEEIILARNLIKILPIEVFDHLRKLRHLDLSHNRLHQLPSETFKNLQQLQHLSITGNPLMQLDVEQILNHTRNLQDIDMTDTFLLCERVERIHYLLRQANVSILMSPSKVLDKNDNKERNYDITFLNNSTCLNEEQFEYQELLIASVDEQVLKLLQNVRVVKRTQDRMINRLLEMENNFRFLEEGLVKIMTEMRQEMNQLKISIEDTEKVRLEP